MNELQVTLGDRSYHFSAGDIVRIGRSPDNDIVVSDPTVSRQHAQLSQGPGGWEFENVGRALSFLNGQPVTRAVLSGPAEIRLSSPNGPVLAVAPGTGVPTQAAPDHTSVLDGAGDPWDTPAQAPWQSPGGGLPPAPVPPAPAPWPGGLGGSGGSGEPDAPWTGQHENPAQQDALGSPGQADAPWHAQQPGQQMPGQHEAPPQQPPAPDQGWPGQQNAPWLGQPDPAWAGQRQHAAGQPPYPPQQPPRVRAAGAHGQPGEELATALHILVPIRSWLHDRGWRQLTRLLVIPYGLLPLIFIAALASSDNLATPGWAYSLYIAPLWAIVFWLLIRPGQLGRREAGIAAGTIVFALIWIRVVTININGLFGSAGKPLSFPGAIGVGLNEEITKALPILLAALLLLRYQKIKLDVRMWMYLGTLVGLAFGVTEQAGYTSLDIAGIANARANSEAIVEVLAFAERVFVDGFQHATWAGVAAFFIGIAVNYPRRRIQLVAFGIAIPALLHAFYDWSAGAFASLWIPIIIQAVSLFLFLGYTMSAHAIERQVKETPMFRGESLLMERLDLDSLRRHGGAPPPGGAPRHAGGDGGPGEPGGPWPSAEPRPPGQG